ncbi:MAG: hypothetical protein GQ558_03545 [Thermoplasmata archaeon]|nr:hypothetical protein [Thermoplasmata archaeon]
MRMHHDGRRARLALLVLLLLAVPCLAGGEAAAEDVEMSTTFLTFFKNGGGYIEYRLHGQAASELRGMIDDPSIRFPFETATADGDGLIDQAEGEQYMRNLDDILTKRQIVLRGIKLDNVDVDEHLGLIGSDVNDTDELYIHITFRGHIQYDQMEFNVSGLEPLMVLYGSYDAIPPTLTIAEKTYIVSAGLGSYTTEVKDEGTLLNMRAPMSAVISFSASYTVSSAPVSRMSYDHSSTVGNPLILMVFTLIITYLAIKLPKNLARDNKKERVRQLHIAILMAVVMYWLFYLLGGAAVLVWVFGFAMVGMSYFFGHQIYAKDWKEMAQPTEGIDLGPAYVATDPVNGDDAFGHPDVRAAPIIGEAGPARIDAPPTEDIILAVPDDAQWQDEEVALRPVVMPGPAATAPQRVVKVPATGYVAPPQPAPAPAQAPAPAPAQAPVPAPAQVPAAQAPVMPTSPTAQHVLPQEAEKSMRCKCGGVFKVPLQPRPLEVQCPHCGTTGVLRS